jgi:16S rRNA (cytosine1402-N4)-methyltransferase
MGMRIEQCGGVPALAHDDMSQIEPPESERPSSAFRGHLPVMPHEVVEWLQPGPGQVIVDCTAGMGGHSLALLPRLMPSGQLIAMDCDAQAIELARKRLTEFYPHVQFLHRNFRQLRDSLDELGITGVHGILADLGISSLHVDEAERGFSFLRDGPLDMRMDQRAGVTAASLVNRMPEGELAHVIQTYGEERWAKRIARRIVSVRRAQPIRTTAQLAQLIADAVPGGRGGGRLHPATRTFQALRVAVNDELGALRELLEALPDVLLPGGRAVLIAFHSLEDRQVKLAFREGARAGHYRLLTKKPQTPSDRETIENPRSRSAKLRAVERLP